MQPIRCIPVPKEGADQSSRESINFTPEELQIYETSKSLLLEPPTDFLATPPTLVSLDIPNTESDVRSIFTRDHSTLLHTTLTQLNDYEKREAIFPTSELASLLGPLEMGERRVCQHPFKKNDIVWVCRTCQADETCVLCHACFSQSDHENHDVSFYHAQAGGCCDCGDPEGENTCMISFLVLLTLTFVTSLGSCWILSSARKFTTRE